MATNPRFTFPLEYVSDISAAKHFYVDVLGLQIEREASTFVQLRDAAGSHYAIASDESVGGRGGLELYWAVDDAEAALREVAPKAEVVAPLRQLPFGKVFAIKSPDGQSQYLIEFAQSRPSQTRGGD
jgi:predicted enzyme related to lactoylglutathione lyase